MSMAISQKSHDFNHNLHAQHGWEKTKEESNIEEGSTALEVGAITGTAYDGDGNVDINIDANERTNKENFLCALSQTTLKEKSGSEEGLTPDQEGNEEGVAIGPSLATDTGVRIGRAVPDFTLACMDGLEHKLSDFRGTKVMLCFYKFAHCPGCAYAISKIVGNYKKLAWATKLKIVFIFRTNQTFLKHGLTSDDALIPRLLDKDCYPFTALADTDGSVGRMYQLETNSVVGTVTDVATMLRKHGGVCNLSFARELSTFPSSPFMLPSELLIDEEGVLVDVLRAEKSSETMNVDRITNFLLAGSRRADRQTEIAPNKVFDFSSKNRRATQ
mmetsp:Transcript_36581/g.76771  ORF Transcript_36581/g.76771 Transcript_36581/m.76771 type:complete len:330 (+) Transcript_36581:42-1031(+)